MTPEQEAFLHALQSALRDGSHTLPMLGELASEHGIAKSEVMDELLRGVRSGNIVLNLLDMERGVEERLMFADCDIVGNSDTPEGSP